MISLNVIIKICSDSCAPFRQLDYQKELWRLRLFIYYTIIFLTFLFIFLTFLFVFFVIPRFHCTFARTSPFYRSPDGGIGRRAGLKHQWSNPSRFEPGSGYYKSLVSLWFTRDFSFSACTKSVLYNSVIRKVYFYVFSPLRFIFN